MEQVKKPKRIPLKTLNQHHLAWKDKLKESCVKRVKEDRNKMLWKFRSPNLQPSSEKELIKSTFQNIVSDELQKIKNQHPGIPDKISSLSGEDDMLWEYDGLHTADEGECEEILLEMQRIFYEDIRLELNQKEAEISIVLEDEEDDYLAAAVEEYMQLNDGTACKERIWCPVCKKGELKENHRLIYCSLCQLKLNRGDEVNLELMRVRLAEAHEEHFDRGCKAKPNFCVETMFDLTALYIQCQQCNTFDVVI